MVTSSDRVEDEGWRDRSEIGSSQEPMNEQHERHSNNERKEI